MGNITGGSQRPSNMPGTVLNNGGTISAGQPELFMWNIAEYPDGPPEHEEEWEEYTEYRSVLRGWSELPIKIERK